MATAAAARNDARVSSYVELLTRTQRLRRDLDRPVVVVISGHGGAGKTTLARQLAADLGVAWEQVLRIDRMKADTDLERATLWELTDWPAVLGALAQARSGSERLTYLARDGEGWEGTVDVEMPRVLVLEGIRVIRPETRPLADLMVWIDLDPETAGARAKARNVLQGDSQAELDLWDTKWIPESHEYERLVEPQRLADLVIPALG